MNYVFITVDLVLYLFLIAAFYYLDYLIIFQVVTMAYSEIPRMIPLVLEVIILLILVFCAFYLAKALKK